MSEAPYILLIEDDALIANLFKDAFTAKGFSVILAFDGKQALTKLEEMCAGIKVPELILLDMLMPKMNGLEVLDYIKKQNPLKKIPVIMLTNSSETEDVEKALEAGAVMYLVKAQYIPQEIVEKAREVIEAYKKDHGENLIPEVKVGMRDKTSASKK